MTRRSSRAVAVAAVCGLVALLLVPELVEDARAPSPADGTPPATSSGHPLLQQLRPRTAPRSETKPHVQSVIVRDLADGSVVAGANLEFRDADSAAVFVTTDDAGHPRNAEGSHVKAERFVSSEPDLHVVAAAPHAFGTERVVWVWRFVRIVCTVESADPERKLVSDKVTLTCKYGGPGADGGSLGPPPWMASWLLKNSIPVTVPSPVGLPDGRFEFSVPRVRGFGIRAHAAGFEAACVVPEFEADREEKVLRMRLTPCLLVGGVLRGADGRPLRNAELRAYVVRRTRHDASSYGHLRVELMDAYTANWLKDEDSARVTAIQRVFTNQRGEFELPLRIRGEVWLVAFADKHVPVERRLGHVSTDRGGLDIQMDAASHRRRVRLLRGGKVLRRSTFLVADLSLSDVQASFTVTTDERGETSTQWLQRGRRYVLALQGAPAQTGSSNVGYFVWQGERELDIAKLEKRP